jgi:four helix bundle protein
MGVCVPWGAPSVPPAVVCGDLRLAGVTEAAPARGMHTPINQQLLDRVILVIEQARPLVAIISRRDRDLASQIRRALSSVSLNVGEGFGVAAGNARLRFESARGSLYEVQAGLRTAVAWGYLSAAATAPLLGELHRLGGRIYGLCRR